MLGQGIVPECAALFGLSTLLLALIPPLWNNDSMLERVQERLAQIEIPRSLDTLIDAGVIWWIVALVTTLFGIYSILLVYHWLRYGVTSPMMLVSMLVYFGVSAVIFSALLLSAAALTGGPALIF